MASAIHSDLLTELECPICTNYMAPPIVQCATGHSICNSCRNHLQQCPLCQGPFTESRNIALESLALKVKYPCINQSLGCKEELSFNDRSIHEMNCSFSKCNCAATGCCWTGKREEIVQHWLSKNLPFKPYKAKNNCFLSIKVSTVFANLTHAFGKLFWFRCKVAGKQIFWSLQYIANDDESEYFVYDIEISKPKRPERRISFSDYCQSYKLGDKDIFKAENCIVSGIDTLKEFTENDRLIYTMKIRQIIIPSKKLAALLVSKNVSSTQAASPQNSQQQGGKNPPKPQGSKQQQPTRAQKKSAAKADKKGV